MTARLRWSGFQTDPYAFALKPGAVAIARTSPVRASSTTAVALFACHSASVCLSTACAFAWIVWSSVR